MDNDVRAVDDTVAAAAVRAVWCRFLDTWSCGGAGIGPAVGRTVGKSGPLAERGIAPAPTRPAARGESRGAWLTESVGLGPGTSRLTLAMPHACAVAAETGRNAGPSTRSVSLYKARHAFARQYHAQNWHGDYPLLNFGIDTPSV